MRLIGAASSALALALSLGISDSGSVQAADPHDGRAIFRFDTFGDEQLWTDALRLHEVIESVTPAQALSLGLKVDAEALPPSVTQALATRQLDVNDPAVTLRLLELNAVVGVVGKVTGHRRLRSVGITCAFCHSTVDDSLEPGIGRRLDGWPNRDLRVGAIAALSPGLSDAVKNEIQDWPPGTYDPRHHMFDGSTLTILNASSLPVVIPPIYGLSGVPFEIYTGDGPISYWNSYVGVTQMGGHGSFSDARIGVEVRQKPDRVTPKLPALLAYQLSLAAPPPPAGSFDAAAAARGQIVFNDVAQCGTCHIAPTYTDVSSGAPGVPFLHDPLEVGADAAYADRSATGMYRTTPLRALWQHPPYFHDGSAADLPAVVNHYVDALPLTLTEAEKADLVEFLKSL
jgi:hypothetical protein